MVWLLWLWLLCAPGSPSAPRSPGRGARGRAGGGGAGGAVRLPGGSLLRARRPGRTWAAGGPRSGRGSVQRDDGRSHPWKVRRVPGRAAAAARSRAARFQATATPGVLAGLAGRQRVWVISAPGPADGYYRLMLSLLKDDVYCELAERHVSQILLFHREGQAAGKVRKITSEGKILEEALPGSAIPKLMDYLKLERGKFGMVLLRKNLQVEEHYPYPVRLEAMYEVIDQGAIRKLERMRQTGFVQRCKRAGLEGQVVGAAQGKRKKGGEEEDPKPVPTSPSAHQVTRQKETRQERGPVRKKKLLVRKPFRTLGMPHGSSRLESTTVMSTVTTTSPPPAPSTTVAVPTATVPTATVPTATVPATIGSERHVDTSFTGSHTTLSHPIPEFHRPPIVIETQTRSTGDPRRDKHQVAATTDWNRLIPSKSTKAVGLSPSSPAPETTVTPVYYTKVQTGKYKDNRTDRKEGDYKRKDPQVSPSRRKPTKVKPPKTKPTNNKILTNEYEDRYDLKKTAANIGGEVEVGQVPPRKVKKKQGKVDKRPKKPKPEKTKKKLKIQKPKKKPKPVKKLKALKATSPNTKKKTNKKQELKKFRKTPAPVAATPLESFLDNFENRRRLLLMTSPNEKNNMYVQQRDEFLESVCEMALRKISIITIFGSLMNSTMKIDHFQLDNEKPMKVIGDNELLDQNLITELRKEYGMTNNDFFMVLADFDMKTKQYYEVPIAMKAVFDFIDTFTTRITEMEKQKKEGLICKKEDKPRSLEHFLSRFRWRRRLFIISTPSDEEWAYQDQLLALGIQACQLGLRHLAVLKLVGVGNDVGGVLELYPINGTSSVDREELSTSLVMDIRNYFQVTAEYFAMLLVGKDGNVKSWYPTPMWNMAIVYDLVDSMQLRRQEMAIQQSLGVRCPEHEYGYGYQHGYYQQGYHGGYHY
ncbi:coiled-coil domain-containing protein 80 [Callorhinchus milii]|uniref:coiled-coil domain-containing protein 80 n=1 Tax=Callorhinchus milii TaxID=7868 RepID=UPI001C3FCC39|nr:coiled-coil domain-containing protein 80 [Callorhinchus milii]